MQNQPIEDESISSLTIGQVYHELQIKRIQRLLDKFFVFRKWSQDFEIDYQNFDAPKFYGQFRVTTLIGTVIFVMLSFFSTVHIQNLDNLNQIFTVESLGPLLGILLLSLLLSRLMSNFHCFYRLHQWSFVTGLLLLGLSFTAFLYFISEEVKLVYFVTVFCFQLYTFGFIRRYVQSASASMLFLFFGYGSIYFALEAFILTHDIIFSVFYCFTSVLALIANYLIECWSRENYLQIRIRLFQAETFGMINFQS